jgi:ribosomal protein S18 acetylase RimI-like enzyme
MEIRLLGRGDAGVLARVAPEVFDNPIDARWTAEFLADARHHLAVALDDEVVVGMASAVHYVHPDKPPELWINEVGVAESHRRRGVGKRLLQALFVRGRELGCDEAWVLTDQSNTGARRLYASAGGHVPPEPALLFAFRLREGDAHSSRRA